MSLLAKLFQEADQASDNPSMIPIPVRVLMIRGKLKSLRQWVARVAPDDTFRLAFAERRLDFLLPTLAAWYPSLPKHWKELVSLARTLDNHYFDVEVELRLPIGMADTIKEIVSGNLDTLI